MRRGVSSCHRLPNFRRDVDSLPILASVYTEWMQLHAARLCLDCQEIHDAAACPACLSESFAYISRWVPAPERRKRPRPVPSPDAETYRQLLAADAGQPKSMRWLKRGALGLTIVSVAGWLWRRSAGEASPATAVKTRRSDDGA